MKFYLFIPFAILLLSCNSIKILNNTEEIDRLLNDVRILSSDEYKGRKTGTEGAEMAKKFIIKRFQEIGLKSFSSIQNYQQNFIFSRANNLKVTGKNLIGFIQGKSDQVIVISAHYDHLGVINGQVFNGADDNASGVAGMLKIATHFSKNKPEYTMIFASFDAEEHGKKGSYYFIDNLPMDIKKIKLNINLDMISHNDKGELYASGINKYPQLKTYILTKIPDIKILFGHDDPKLGIDDWTNQSDQAAFNSKNIPFIYFGVEDHKDYHKETDEFKNINSSFYINAANAILEITNRIDKNISLESAAREKVKMKMR